MAFHGSVAKAARERKEKHPDLYCPATRCLWRTGDGSRCPRHGGSAHAVPARLLTGPRLPVKGDRVEYIAGLGSPTFTGTATGAPCGDPACSYVHVIPDHAPTELHHIPLDHFEGDRRGSKWARVVDEGEAQDIE